MIPSLSVVINTCAISHQELPLSSGRQAYSDRAWLLANVILPVYTRWLGRLFVEVVVVGEYVPAPDITYVPCPSVHKSCVDALAQRQAGYEALKNHAVEWILFQHDDHLFDPNNELLGKQAADVLSPSRWTHGRTTIKPERLNDGSFPWNRPRGKPYELGYVNGHGCLMRPSVLRNGFRWTDVAPVHTWDVEATKLLERLGVKVSYIPELKLWDMERGATPWA